MYYEIAEQILNATLGNNYNLITDVTKQVQQSLNQSANVGIKAIVPELNQDRIDGLVNKVSSYDSYDDAAWVLDEPVKTFSQSIVDDSIKANAEFHSKCGMQPKIVRKIAGNCCEWCRNLAGSYTYPDDVPEDVYRRHQRCRCMVDYKTSDGKIQNVHTKQWRTQEEYNKTEVRKRINKSEEEKTFEELLLERGYAEGSFDRIGSNDIDMSYIYSEEYAKKFNGISKNEELNKALYKSAMRLLEVNKGSDTEGTYILNSKNGKTILNKQGKKNAIGVGLSEKEYRIIRNNSVVGIHNHPTNLMPNGSDFAAAGYRNYEFGVIATHDGRVFKYSVGDKPFMPTLLDYRIDKYIEKEYNLSVEEAYIKVLNEFRREYGISWQELK